MAIQYQNLSIGKKISFAVIVVLLPIFLMAYYFVTEEEGLIVFARQEIAGVNYLRAAQQALNAATSAPSKSAFTAAIDAVNKAEQADGGGLNVTQKSHDLVAALQLAVDGKDADDLIGKTTDLISTLSDNSNITLDPDGDAYFVGDIIVNQATGVLSQTANFVAAAKNMAGTPTDDQKIAFAEARDGIATSAGNLATDLAKGFKGNADGSLKAALEADGKAVADAAAAVAAAAGSMNMNAIATASDDLAHKTQALTLKTNDEMERLLNARIQGFDDTMLKRLSIVSLLTVIGGAIFFMIVRSVTKPIAVICTLMSKLSDGELKIETPKYARRDEIGKLSDALTILHGAAIKREEARLAEVERGEMDKQRAQLIQRLCSAFETKIQGIVGTVASASTELAHTAESVTNMVEKTANDAKTAATSSMQTSSNVQSVASAAEEMSASVKEISSQVQRTNMLASDSKIKTETADEKANSLGEAAHKVSEAVTLIANIASQINLLALNATIESARAGEAGKGFAVVASEVKNLANQTNKSVEDVSKVIEELKIASNEIIEALKSIKASVENVSNASSNIAAAVEEQSATTNEITSNMNSAADGTRVIAQNLDSVSIASAEASQATSQVLIAAQELSRQSEELNREVGEFLQSIRNA